jgi:hypothetical protein
MSKPAGEIGRLRDEELPAVRVIVPPDPSGRVFEDDLDPGDVVFDGKRTAMLIWHERYPLGRGWRSGWVLSWSSWEHPAARWSPSPESASPGDPVQIESLDTAAAQLTHDMRPAPSSASSSRPSPHSRTSRSVTCPLPGTRCLRQAAG